MLPIAQCILDFLGGEGGGTIGIDSGKLFILTPSVLPCPTPLMLIHLWCALTRTYFLFPAISAVRHALAGSGAFKIFHPMLFQKALDVFYMWPERGEEWGLGEGCVGEAMFGLTLSCV